LIRALPDKVKSNPNIMKHPGLNGIHTPEGELKKSGKISRIHEFSIRLTDVVLSFTALLALSPAMLLVALLIKLEDGGPVFYVQERVGHMGKLFRLIKFRSMVVGADRLGAGLYIDGENDGRITKVGRFIRKWSIDELPQLVNVLKGDMSIVGPRPGMPFHLKEYTPRQKRRLLVKPGITGWAQINGRNSLSWPERIELDLWYIRHRSLMLNLKIILKTLPAVIKPSGLYAEREKFLFGGENKSALN